MPRLIHFSTTFPKGHPRQGQRTQFAAKIIASLPKQERAMSAYDYGAQVGKLIQSGRAVSEAAMLLDDVEEVGEYTKYSTFRFTKLKWKVGDVFQPVVWSGQPYNSKVIQICKPLKLTLVEDFFVTGGPSTCLWRHGQIGYSNGETSKVAIGPSSMQMTTAANMDGLRTVDFLDWIGNCKPDTQVKRLLWFPEPNKKRICNGLFSSF